jgi:glycosyltransferase involved in cell wall biosynthesis
MFQPAPHKDRVTAVPLILTVGRLVDKKGFADLLQACALLKAADQVFRCLIYGEGPLQDELNTQITALGLLNHVSLPGACTQQELAPVMQQADIFALTPYVTDDGDRDGVPNVLVEAMACGVPVVSTTVGGIPELVTHEVNGLLAAPHDVESIAVHLATLLADGTLRQRLGAAAAMTAREHFNLQTAAHRLTTLFGGGDQHHYQQALNHESFTTTHPTAK